MQRTTKQAKAVLIRPACTELHANAPFPGMLSPTVGRPGGKYRLRTWLRGHLPYVLSDRIPKGSRDCGNHAWYRQDGDHDACYHCVVGVRPHFKTDSEAPSGAHGPSGREPLPA
jgi:hypothetical protein